MPNGFVVALGMGTVFVGLIFLILVCQIVGRVCSWLDARQAAKNPVPETAPVMTRQEAEPLIAAVTAVLAEELGQSAGNIRILSFKKL